MTDWLYTILIAAGTLTVIVAVVDILLHYFFNELGDGSGR